MKIAYLSSPFLADCDLPLLRELTAIGHTVTYFLLVSPASKQATVINIPRLLPQGTLRSATAYPSLQHLDDYLPLDHIYVVNMPQAHDWHPAAVTAIYHTCRFLATNNYDLLHLTAPLRYGAFLLYTLQIPMVLTMHDPLPHSSDRNILNSIHRHIAFRRIKHFIVLSDSLKEEFINTYHLQHKSVYISRLSIYDTLQHVAPQPLSLPKRYILFIGSINPHKGIRYLCDAMAVVNKTDKDLSLVIAGRGTFDFDIASYCARLPIHCLHRFVTDGELVTLIKGAICVVCPYIDATQSGVIMSSFAMNTPVIATNVGALHEMFTHNEHGLLIPPRDSNAIAQAIHTMLDSTTAETMAKNIRAEFSKGSRSWRAIAQQTSDIYQRVITKR